jgi:aminoglycoside/choline kinase family phosphotransferase
MSELRPELRAVLIELYPGARHETLPGDASTRRFHRLFLADGATRVVMDYGSAFEAETDDVRLARIFARAELPVARVLHVLPSAGALVIEDLGDETLETALTHADSNRLPARRDLYRSAVRLTVDIATQGTDALLHSDRASGPALDEERFTFEMRFFLEHYIGSFLGRPEVSTEVRESVEVLATQTASHPRVLCHRDFHSRNIMVRHGGALALVDIQDARWGPDTYDVASLLRDAYVDIGEDEVDELFNQYCQQLPRGLDLGAIRSRFDVVAAQRMIKALGTFGYQIAVLGRERYRSSLHRTVERLVRVLPARVETASLAETLLRHRVLFS